ncbi:MAG: DUF47 family protein [Deltaproteobacteria bacterium]|nr:DUF47 family protein [Deltaproteobacteria bacterium]
MGFQNVVRWLMPREDHFYGFLEQQAQVAHRAARALAKFNDEPGSLESVRDEVSKLEHEGDDLLHGMEDALARTFVTPIDREDLQRLSRRLDDVADLLDLTGRSFVLFGVTEPTKPITALMLKLVECTQVLTEAVPRLRRHEYNEIVEAGRRVQDMEHEADILFRDAISALFRDPKIDAKVLLREKEVLEDLENAMDRCSSVARTLTNIAVKNG